MAGSTTIWLMPSFQGRVQPHRQTALDQAAKRYRDAIAALDDGGPDPRRRMNFAGINANGVEETAFAQPILRDGEGDLHAQAAALQQAAQLAHPQPEGRQTRPSPGTIR